MIVTKQFKKWFAVNTLELCFTMHGVEISYQDCESCNLSIQHQLRPTMSGGLGSGGDSGEFSYRRVKMSYYEGFSTSEFTDDIDIVVNIRQACTRNCNKNFGPLLSYDG